MQSKLAMEKENRDWKDSAAMNDVLLKKEEVAKMLGIGVMTVRRMAARGEIPVVRLSSKIVRYRQSDIAAIISGNLSRQLVVNRRAPTIQKENNRTDRDEPNINLITSERA